MPFDGKDFALPAVETDSVLRCLTEARCRIETNWWAGTGDRASLCRGTDPQCATNTVYLMEQHDYATARGPALDLLARALPTPADHFGAVWPFNDTIASHEEILALFDRAIAARRGELS
jgi:hypothetical protein